MKGGQLLSPSFCEIEVECHQHKCLGAFDKAETWVFRVWHFGKYSIFQHYNGHYIFYVADTSIYQEGSCNTSEIKCSGRKQYTHYWLYLDVSYRNVYWLYSMHEEEQYSLYGTESLY